MQSALIGTELALKAGLVAHGLTETELRKKDLGHNLTALTERLAPLAPKFDVARVLGVVSKFPPYVENRYDGAQPERRQVGSIIMGGQYVAAEVMRLFSDRDLRSAFSGELPRVYPPMPKVEPEPEGDLPS